MIDHSQFHLFAVEIILRQRGPTQIHLRGAVSALYYGLFHDLTARGAPASSVGGPELLARVARAHDHRAISTVCRMLPQPRTGPLPTPFAALIPGDLMVVARAAHRMLDEIEREPEATAVLAALLRNDRLGRRG